MLPVVVDMDRDWVWRLLGASQSNEVARQVALELAKVKLQVPLELVNRYERVAQEWFELQQELEQLYRVQQGLKPWSNPPIPPHEVQHGS